MGLLPRAQRLLTMLIKFPVIFTLFLSVKSYAGLAETDPVLVGRAIGPRNWDSEEGRGVIKAVLGEVAPFPLAVPRAYDYPASRLLVTPDWVSKNLDNPKVRLVDLRSTDAYRQGHIKNAVHFKIDNLFALREGVLGLLPRLSK